ncbi:MAG: cupin domain-containing protein [Pseudomonadota bacterium]
MCRRRTSAHQAAVYPEPFASRIQGREKRQLGEQFGLTNFGVNLTRMAPGASSARRHAHTLQDEFVYIVSGQATLHTDEGKTVLSAGICAGFKAGSGDAHRLINVSADDAFYLEVGDRSAGDVVHYPNEDLVAIN